MNLKHRYQRNQYSNLSSPTISYNKPLAKMTAIAAPTTVAGKPVGPVGFGMMSESLLAWICPWYSELN